MPPRLIPQEWSTWGLALVGLVAVWVVLHDAEEIRLRFREFSLSWKRRRRR